MNNKVFLSSKHLKKEKKFKRIIKISLLVIMLLLLLLYLVVGIIYNSGNFSITLDKNLYFERGLIIYDNPEYKVYRTELYAPSPTSFDNISYKWLPENVDKYEGSNNGENYLAYSFYIENIGDKFSDFWTEIVIDDVIKNVDEAIRIRVYKDEQVTTYAKQSSNGSPEKETVPFSSDTMISSDHIQDLKPGEKIKYTIVLWLEGSDPECTDNILGGEIKIHMDFNSEFVEN